VIAAQKNGTLELHDGPDAQGFTARINSNITWHKDAWQAIEDSLVTTMSFNHANSPEFPEYYRE
jgi:hypothetical protein